MSDIIEILDECDARMSDAAWSDEATGLVLIRHFPALSAALRRYLAIEEKVEAEVQRHQAMREDMMRVFSPVHVLETPATSEDITEALGITKEQKEAAAKALKGGGGDADGPNK